MSHGALSGGQFGPMKQPRKEMSSRAEKLWLAGFVGLLAGGPMVGAGIAGYKEAHPPPVVSQYEQTQQNPFGER